MSPSGFPRPIVELVFVDPIRRGPRSLEGAVNHWQAIALAAPRSEPASPSALSSRLPSRLLCRLAPRTPSTRIGRQGGNSRSDSLAIASFLPLPFAADRATYSIKQPVRTQVILNTLGGERWLDSLNDESAPHLRSSKTVARSRKRMSKLIRLPFL
jgi:hypothetical protein